MAPPFLSHSTHLIGFESGSTSGSLLRFFFQYKHVLQNQSSFIGFGNIFFVKFFNSCGFDDTKWYPTPIPLLLQIVTIYSDMVSKIRKEIKLQVSIIFFVQIFDFLVHFISYPSAR